MDTPDPIPRREPTAAAGLGASPGAAGQTDALPSPTPATAVGLTRLGAKAQPGLAFTHTPGRERCPKLAG